MPREKKVRPTRRKDGRYVCRYKGQYFYSTDPDNCIAQREQFKELERRGRIMPYFVTEYAKNWLDRAYPNIHPSTKRGLKIHLEKLINAIGELPVSDVKPSDIKSIYSDHYNGLSNSYINAAKQLYCALFDSAVADGLIISNPARDKTAQPHKGTYTGHRAITPQERTWIETLCVNHRAHPVAMAMLYAGIRPQEAKALRIERDVDFEHDTITVRETAHIDPNNGQKYAVSVQGKTSKANRTIPLLPPLKRALEGRTGLLVTSAHGQPVTRTTWRVLWRSYCAQMEKEINGIDRRWYGRTKAQKTLDKLPPWVFFTVTPYDLRHSFATMCRSMTPPIEMHTVISWMGHADSKMILKVYDEVTTDRDKAEGDRLRAALR